MKRNMLAFAISIVAQAFEERLDKGGKPYVLHLIRVMEAMDENDQELKQIAILHDLIEDTSWTIENMRETGFSERVIKAVDLLTHRTEDSYDIYIRKISTNIDAVKVKRADLIDNSQLTRLKGLTKANFENMEKYHKAFVYLSSI